MSLEQYKYIFDNASFIRCNITRINECGSKGYRTILVSGLDGEVKKLENEFLNTDLFRFTDNVYNNNIETFLKYKMAELNCKYLHYQKSDDNKSYKQFAKCRVNTLDRVKEIKSGTIVAGESYKVALDNFEQLVQELNIVNETEEAAAAEAAKVAKAAKATKALNRKKTGAYIKCNFRTKKGLPCKKYAITGKTYCNIHKKYG
jgi:hypothetical protein